MFKLFPRRGGAPRPERAHPGKTQELKAPEQPFLTVPLDDAGNSVQLRFGNAQAIGDRQQQQDAFGYSNILDVAQVAQKGVLAILADGMGGLQNGRQVSEYTVGAMLRLFEGVRYDENLSGQLEEMAVQVNRQVCAGHGNSGQAGSTLVAALLYKTRLHWACVGDSRLYVYRKNALYQLNEDHTYQTRLLHEHIRGARSLESARGEDQLCALVSYIGSPTLPQVDRNRRGFALQRGDRLVLCTDGVYNAVNNAELISCLHSAPQDAANAILETALAKRHPGQDNATVMIIEYR